MMTTQNTQWHTHGDFEKTQFKTEQTLLIQLIRHLQKLSRALFRRLTTTEPVVKQVRNRDGQIWWFVYDPTTERSAYLASEAEVLIWLEARFYDRRTHAIWHQNNRF